MMLADALPAQGFASNRIVYLGKHVKAMEMLCRKLSGEHFSLKEEAEFCLDIHPKWTLEEEFKKLMHCMRKYSLERGACRKVAHLQDRTCLSEEHMKDLSQNIDMAFAEARRRTYSLLNCPMVKPLKYSILLSGNTMLLLTIKVIFERRS